MWKAGLRSSSMRLACIVVMAGYAAVHAEDTHVADNRTNFGDEHVTSNLSEHLSERLVDLSESTTL